MEEPESLLVNRTDDGSDIVPSPIPSSKGPYKVFKRRWMVLLAVFFLNASNAIVWVCFAPIADVTGAYFKVDSDKVNWLSLVFLIVSVPTGFFSTWFLDTIGLRGGIILGSWINVIGAGVRTLSAFDFVPDSYKFTVAIAGQTIAAIAQPFAMASPAKVASLWFPEQQRMIATTVASMSNPFGILIGSALSPIIASSASKMPTMLIIWFIPCAVSTVISTFGVWSSKPPTPPSSSAAEESEPYFAGLKQIIRIKSFRVLLVVLGAGLGLFTTLTTLIEQILCTRGYSDNFAGLCSALMIIFGLVMSVVLGLYVDKTRNFEITAKICFAFAGVFGCGFVAASQFPNIPIVIGVLVSLFGGFGFAFYPICLELGVECTFPVAEATSTGLLVISGQIQGIIYIVLMQIGALPLPFDQMKYQVCSQSKSADGGITPQDFQYSLYGFGGIMAAVAILFLFTFHCEYKRLKMERERQQANQ